MDQGAGAAIGIAVISGLVGWVRQSRSEERHAGAREEATTAAQAMIEQRFAALKQSERTMAEELRGAMAELRSAATQIKVLAAEQSVINRLNTVTLQGLAASSQSHDRSIAEHGTAIAFLQKEGR